MAASGAYKTCAEAGDGGEIEAALRATEPGPASALRPVTPIKKNSDEKMLFREMAFNSALQPLLTQILRNVSLKTSLTFCDATGNGVTY